MQIKIGDLRLLDITVIQEGKEIYKGKAEDAPEDIKDMKYKNINFEGVKVVIEI